MQRFALLGLACLFAASGANADDSVVAHPAYWMVQAKSGTAFILSSVHALQPNVQWRNRVIDAAAERADTYVFEVGSGKKEDDEALRFVLERGRLPGRQTLQALLPPASQKDYVAACTLAGMQATSLAKARPWLAAVLLTVNYMSQRHLNSANTPDDAYYARAMRDRKKLVYLDTTREQLEFVARYDETEGVSGFSAMLGDFANQPGRINNLITTWSNGDTSRMAMFINASFRNDPEGAKIFAQHNKGWTMQLERLLDSGGNYFVVVGVAHLVGPNGVPAMLRADGYTVQGP